MSIRKREPIPHLLMQQNDFHIGRLEVNVHTKQQQEQCCAGLHDKLGMQLFVAENGNDNCQYHCSKTCRTTNEQHFQSEIKSISFIGIAVV